MNEKYERFEKRMLEILEKLEKNQEIMIILKKRGYIH